MGNQLSNKAEIVRGGPFSLTPHHVNNALCSDGVRRYARITGDSDTFFSMPAAVKVKGKTVSGFITETEDGEDIQFIAFTYGKNGHLLP